MIRPAVNESARTLSGSFPAARYFELSALIAGSIAVWWRPLVSTLKLALGSDAYTHILLIAPLSVALIYFERSGVPYVPSRRGWAGWVLLSVALLLRALTAASFNAAPADILLSLSVFGLVLWWIGSVVVSFGSGIFRSRLFSALLSLSDCPGPDWSGELDNTDPAISVCRGSHFAISHRSSPSDERRPNHFDPRVGPGGGARVQQHPIEHDAHRNHTCAGASFSSIEMAKGLPVGGVIASGGCKERNTYLHYRRIGHSCGPGLPGRQVTSQRGNPLPRPRSDDDRCLIVGLEAGRVAKLSSGPLAGSGFLEG